MGSTELPLNDERRRPRRLESPRQRAQRTTWSSPFTLAPLARHFDATDPLKPAAAQEHADLVADLLVHALETDPAQTAETGPAA